MERAGATCAKAAYLVGMACMSVDSVVKALYLSMASAVETLRLLKFPIEPLCFKFLAAAFLNENISILI